MGPGGKWCSESVQARRAGGGAAAVAGSRALGAGAVGGLRAASAPVLSLPPRKLEDKWRGRLSTSLLPSPAGRGSAPGWGGGGPDARDWPRQHLGRLAPLPPAVGESAASLPRGAALEPALGAGLGRLEAARPSASPVLTRQSPRDSARPQPGPGRGERAEQELRRFKTATSLCARPRQQGGDPDRQAGGRRPGAVSLASSPPWARGPASSADDTRNWMPGGLQGDKEGLKFPLTQKSRVLGTISEIEPGGKKLWPSGVPGEPLAYCSPPSQVLSNGRHLSDTAFLFSKDHKLVLHLTVKIKFVLFLNLFSVTVREDWYRFLIIYPPLCPHPQRLELIYFLFEL